MELVEKSLQYMRASRDTRERIARVGIRAIDGYLAIAGGELKILIRCLGNVGAAGLDLATVREVAGLLFGLSAPNRDTIAVYNATYTDAVTKLFVIVDGEDAPPPWRWSGESVARLIAALFVGFPDEAARSALAAELGFPIGEMPNPYGGVGVIFGAHWVTAADVESAGVLRCLLSACATGYAAAAVFGAKAYRASWGAPEPNALADAVRATKALIAERAMSAMDMNDGAANDDMSDVDVVNDDAANDDVVSVDFMIESLADCVQCLRD